MGNEDGQVWLGYVKPEELKDRHDVDDHDGIFDKMTGALDAMTNAALERNSLRQKRIPEELLLWRT